MRSPLTFRIESAVGSIFVLIFTAFMIGLFFIANKNFESELDILSIANPTAKTYAKRETILINKWVEENKILIPSGKSRIRYLLEQYPDRPWF